MENDILKEEFKDLLIRLHKVKMMIRNGQNVDAFFQVQGAIDKVSSLRKQTISKDEDSVADLVGDLVSKPNSDI